MRSPQPADRLIVELRRWTRREEHGTLGALFGSELFERRDVIEDIDTPAVRADDHVVIARMDLNVIDSHGRQSFLQLLPMRSAIG